MAESKGIDIESKELASVIARILDNKKAKDIDILDISNVSVIGDYFVICSADTSTQVRALTSSVKEKIKELFERMPSGSETDPKHRWNLLDYQDVIVHIMHYEDREFYALEKFWSHAFKLSEEDWMGISEGFKDKL